MKIERISFEQLYPTGIYANQRYRAEASVEEGEDLVECYKVLQSKTEAAFVAMNPHIKWNEAANQYGQNISYASSTPNVIDRKKIDETEIKIDNCTTVDELKGLESDALKYGLVNQYINKKKTFQ